MDHRLLSRHDKLDHDEQVIVFLRAYCTCMFVFQFVGMAVVGHQWTGQLVTHAVASAGMSLVEVVW